MDETLRVIPRHTHIFVLVIRIIEMCSMGHIIICLFVFVNYRLYKRRGVRMFLK